MSDGNVYICNSLFKYNKILDHLSKLMDSIEPNIHKVTKPLYSRCLTCYNFNLALWLKPLWFTFAFFTQ